MDERLLFATIEPKVHEPFPLIILGSGPDISLHEWDLIKDRTDRDLLFIPATMPLQDRHNLIARHLSLQGLIKPAQELQLE